MTRKAGVFLGTLFLIALIYLSFELYVTQQEVKQTVVTLKTNDPRTIVFYREDCPDCQRLYKRLYVRKVIKGNQVFVNLNQRKNRKYIVRYQLREVPTIIEATRRYEGYQEIKQKIDTESLF